MINRLWVWLARFLLWLRYRVRVRGLREVASRGRSGVLFLPNHPALIDPIILISRLWPRFRVRALGDRDQLDRFLIRRLARRFRVIPIPDLDKPLAGTPDEIRKVVAACVDALRAGDSIMVYPQGRLDRQRLEDLGGNSAVESILRELPEVRVVLVRTRGLWGSGFGYASGTVPDVAKLLRKGARGLALSGIFFAPRRRVDIELVEPADIPRAADRNDLNRWLEGFYNDGAPPNTYVPYSIWEPGGTRAVPEPERPKIAGDLALVPQTVRDTVLRHVTQLTGAKDVTETTRLAHDLAMDSLSRMEIIMWLHAEFGIAAANTDALVTVGDIMLAASGQAVASGPPPLKEVPRAWFEKLPRPTRPEGLARMTIPEAFLVQASRKPGAAILADQNAGVLTYRDVVTRVMLLSREIAKLSDVAHPPPGEAVSSYVAQPPSAGVVSSSSQAGAPVLHKQQEAVGIMLPASAAAGVTYLATLFAGKTPAMINWTLGRQNLAHCLESVSVERILTSRALVARLTAQGVDLDAFAEHFVYLEDLAAKISLGAKLCAAFHSRASWHVLREAARRIRPDATAAILFTSGSESVPKAVPLSHRNILTNVSDCYDVFTVRPSDSILGILPPFHSFGLTTSVVLPLTLAGRAVYHPSPTDGAALAAVIDAYKTTILMGTPTFLHGIVRAAYVAHPPSGEDVSDVAQSPSAGAASSSSQAGAPVPHKQQLHSLRLVVSGAEKCSERVYRAVAEACPQTTIMEGYGVTECSPVISVNPEYDARPGTIGKPLASVEIAVVDLECRARVERGNEGMLLVRGVSVFSGYMNYDGLSPFVELDGKQWYRTGDLVREDADGRLTFAGRLKRFAKLGGEMVSLPAIEAALEPRLVADDGEGPVLAVVATPSEESPEIVLFTTKPIERDEANAVIRAAGLSGLHNIRRVIKVDQLPTLGTGKTDYRALVEQLKSSDSRE